MFEPLGTPRPAGTVLAPVRACRLPGMTYGACAWLVASAAGLAGCFPDMVEPGSYAPDATDAQPDASSPDPSSPTNPGAPEAGPPDNSDEYAGATSAQPSGPCDPPAAGSSPCAP